jgi:CheY-like chemotaxis protein
MTVPLEDVIVPEQILLVEDHELAREALAQLLTRRGYKVALADSGSGAVLQARSGKFGIVLMDIRLGDDMDGIEAAKEIQILHPLTSFIFVTAYANDTGYQERVRESRIRVGGWLEKPIEVNDLATLIEREFEKLKVLSWLDEVQEYGGDPFKYLDSLTEHLAPEIYTDLLEELRSRKENPDPDETEEILPLREDEEDPVMNIAAEIDSVYGEIRDLVAQRQGDPGLKEALHPLRVRLEALQEREADAMERRFRARLRFDPREGRELIRRAGELLRKR